MKRSSFSRIFSFILPAACVTIMSCGGSTSSSETDSTSMSMDSSSVMEMDTASMAIATLAATTDTALSGTATFTKQGGEVKMDLELTVPSKAGKSVAVHIHAMGECGDMGKMAGGHWNPTNTEHGKWGSGNYHSGDIGNVDIDANGKGSLTITTDKWTIGGDTTTNIVGRTIIVHGGVDDYTSQPAGNSGERIGCGIIGKQ